RRSNAVLEHLASLGIEERHVNATHINAQPEYRWDQQRETQVLTGYSVQRSIELALMDLSLLSAVIEGSADAGANQISPPQLSHSNEAEFRRSALRLATEDARANARAIADGLGSTLGEVRDISAAGSPRPVPMAKDMMLRTAQESAAPAASYVAGDMVFEARVNATFN
ncbi:MAG: SIMPL domain-containing protein, partial [Chromatocurvus sp.]